MASKKKLLAEGKRKISEKISSIDEQVNYIHKFIDGIVTKSCSDAKDLLMKSDSKFFLKHYSRANQELEGCLDKLFLIRASLPELYNDTDCSENDEESAEDDELLSVTGTTVSKDELDDFKFESTRHKNISRVATYGSQLQMSHQSITNQHQSSSASIKKEWFDVIEKTTAEIPVDSSQLVPGTIKPSVDIGQLVSGNIKPSVYVSQLVPGTIRPSVNTGQFVPGTIKPSVNISQLVPGTVKPSVDSGKLVPGTFNTSVEVHQLIPVTVKPSVDDSQLVQHTIAPSDVGCHNISTSSQSLTSTQHQRNVSSDIIHGLKYQPDTISKLLQQSAMQPRIPNTIFTDGTILEVLVTEVVSPTVFWIQPIASSLAALMEKISETYSGGRGQMLTFPVIGMACCSCFTQDDCWYRARIIDIYPSGCTSEVEVKVVYVDFGNCEKLPLGRLRYLIPELAALPAQAVCVGLANVKPPGVTKWNHEQTLFFVKLVVNQTLTAKISFRPGTPAPIVDLTYDLIANQTSTKVFSESDTSPTIKVSVGELMIENGHADRLVENMASKNAPKKSSETATEDDPIDSQSKTSSKTCAAKDQMPEVSPITKARQLCERLNQVKETGNLERAKDEQLGEDAVNKNEQSTVCQTKSRLSSGVSSATNVSGPGVSQNQSTSHEQSEVKSINVKKPIKFANIPKQSSKEESVRRGRGRGRGKRSTRSVSDASSEDSIPTGLVSNRSQPPRIPSSQIESEMPKTVATKETNPVVVPSLPTKTSSSLVSKPPANSTEVISSVTEPTSLAERKEKLKEGECIDIAASYIVSPNEFYCHVITRDARKLDYLMDELNDHFDTNASKDVNTDLAVAVGCIYCARFSEDNKWYRVKALEVKQRKTNKNTVLQVFVHIYYVDFGNKEWILKSELHKLPSWFFDLPPQVIRCSLAHVSPKKPQKEGSTEDGWSKKAVEKFVDLTGYLQHRTACVVSTEMVSDMMTFSLILTNIVDGVQTCINDRMVTLGHGQSEIFSVECDVPVIKINYKDLVSSRTVDVQTESASNETTTETSLTSNVQSPSSEENEVPTSDAQEVLKSTPKKEEVPTSDEKELPVSPSSDAEKLADGKTCLSPDSAVLEKSNPEKPADGKICLSPDSAVLEKSNPEKPADGNTCLSPDSAALEKWNPMTEDFVSLRNAYNIDVDDPGVATVGYKTENVHKICPFFAKGDICYRGDNCKLVHSTVNVCRFHFEKLGCYWGDWCPNRHVLPRALKMLINGNKSCLRIRQFNKKINPSKELGRETVDAYWTDNPMPLPEVGSCVAIQVTAYHSACHFWAQLPYGPKPLEEVKVERGINGTDDEGETLESLVDSINNIYGKSSHSAYRTDLLVKAQGELVCAKHKSDNKWYRARVVSANAEENTVQVFYLDYGNSEVVPESSLRPMLPQFLHLPFQAVECFLHKIALKKPDEARKVLEELTTGKILVGLVKTSLVSGTLHVVLIDTSGPTDVYIHQELINQGLAIVDPYFTKKNSTKGGDKLVPG